MLPHGRSTALKKDSAGAMKQKGKEDAGDKPLLVCMDLQGLLLCPKLQASALYYKAKLRVHNFTIFDMISHDATNYLWHEDEAGLSASCIILKQTHCMRSTSRGMMDVATKTEICS